MRTLLTIAAACGAVAIGTTMLYHLLHPDCVSYRNGENHFAQGQHAEAAEDYQTAIEKGSREPHAYLRLAECQLLLGRDSEARETARLFLGISAKQTPETVYALSELFVAHGRFDVSVQLLTGLVFRNPHNRNMRFRLAQALTLTQQFDEAIKQYHVILAEKP